MVKIRKAIYREMIEKTGSVIESGGVFCMKDGTITEFFYDTEGKSADHFYKPNSERVNEVVNRWVREGYSFGGYVHSHRSGLCNLSPMDIVFAKIAARTNSLDHIYMGIVSDFELYLYKLPGVSPVEKCEYELVD